MPRTGATLLSVWLLAGCASVAEDRAESTSIVVLRHLEAPLPDRAQQHDQANDGSPPSTPTNAAAGTPTAAPTPVGEAVDVAAQEVIRRLEAEDLFVLELQSDTETADGTTAAVQLRVLYGTGRGHPTETTYRVWLDLHDRGWMVTSLETAS